MKLACWSSADDCHIAHMQHVVASILSVFISCEKCKSCFGIIVGKAVDMSYDHKPEDELELARIKNAGGKVTMDGRVNGGLNLSRAIGRRFGD